MIDASGSVAAISHETLAGMGAHARSGAQAISAKAPWP